MNPYTTLRDETPLSPATMDFDSITKTYPERNLPWVSFNSVCGFIFVLGAAFSLLFFTGCAWYRSDAKKPVASQLKPADLVAPTETSRSVDASLLQRPSDPYTLGPGDKLEIEILGDPASRAVTEVGPDGKIYYFLLGGLDVWGKTLPQARDLVSQELQKFLREKQQVSLSLKSAESQKVWILGRLNSPGVYPIAAPTTLLEAISMAGGPASASPLGSVGGGQSASAFSSEDASDLRRSFIIRHGQIVPVDFTRLLRNGDLSQNVYLQPDDFIYLPSATNADEVHVLGAVGIPRSVGYVNNLSLVQTIANAGGTIKDAYLSHVAIVRGSLTDPHIAIIDYAEIVHGNAPDVLLQPDDIVYVPYSPYRTINRYVDLILQTFVRTVGVNEGARINGSRNASLGVNVSVPVGP